MTAETFGERLRRIRREKKYTIMELAEMSGVSTATISKVERGGAGSAGADLLMRLADALEVSMDYLYCHDAAGMKRLAVKLEKGALMPMRAYEDDAGLDLYSRDDRTVQSYGSTTFDTGVHVELPRGTAGIIKSKSGLNVNHNITSDGVIDAGYTGTIRVKLYNHGAVDYRVHKGDKISQLVIVPVVMLEPMMVERLDKTERGDNGFGSSGVGLMQEKERKPCSLVRCKKGSKANCCSTCEIRQECDDKCLNDPARCGFGRKTWGSEDARGV